MFRNLLLSAGVAALAAAPLSAQNGSAVTLEARAVAMTPTFGIADQDRVGADIGAGFGFGLGIQVADRVRLMGDFDAGFHRTEIGDVNTYHYMAKVGYDVVRSGKVTVTLNTGAGLVAITPDGADAFNYFAINAGAKIGIQLSPAVELLLSPQGDIAFTKESEVLTKAAWIWPFAAGLRVTF